MKEAQRFVSARAVPVALQNLTRLWADSLLILHTIYYVKAVCTVMYEYVRRARLWADSLLILHRIPTIYYVSHIPELYGIFKELL